MKIDDIPHGDAMDRLIATRIFRQDLTPLEHSSHDWHLENQWESTEMTCGHCHASEGDEGPCIKTPFYYDYSTCDNAALGVLSWLMERAQVTIQNIAMASSLLFRVHVNCGYYSGNPDGQVFQVQESTLALALCRVALKYQGGGNEQL